jgi:hypothetical protein
MSYIKGDPHWVTASADGICVTCADSITKGERCFYWPKSRLQPYIECARCGEASERRFLAEIADEHWS